MMNTIEKGEKNLKKRDTRHVVFETRGRHSRSQESPVSLLLIQRNRQGQKKKKRNRSPIQQKTRHPKPAFTSHNNPKKQTNEEYKNTDSTPGWSLL